MPHSLTAHRTAGGIEFWQLSEGLAELFRRSAVARLVLGSIFDPSDLLWYVVGAVAGWFVLTAVRREVQGLLVACRRLCRSAMAREASATCPAAVNTARRTGSPTTACTTGGAPSCIRHLA
ncbi:DUF2809 domain-containing protein [Streptomyces sp. NPDC056309]|uniref:DUF2809 domain-containing protein n=1 Tax=unclassified Streptomyces TaxID=2593676 RepID=UPI0035D60B03